MTETLYLIAGLWLGMGATCWIVPFVATWGREPTGPLDLFAAAVCPVLGPVAVFYYARHERERY